MGSTAGPDEAHPYLQVVQMPVLPNAYGYLLNSAVLLGPDSTGGHQSYIWDQSWEPSDPTGGHNHSSDNDLNKGWRKVGKWEIIK